MDRDFADRDPDGDDTASDPRWRLVDTLAEVFSNHDEARLLVEMAGVPRQDIPRFDTPRTFWHRIISMLEDGRVVGGIDTLTDAATQLYPSRPSAVCPTTQAPQERSLPTCRGRPLDRSAGARMLTCAVLALTAGVLISTAGRFSRPWWSCREVTTPSAHARAVPGDPTPRGETDGNSVVDTARRQSPSPPPRTERGRHDAAAAPRTMEITVHVDKTVQLRATPAVVWKALTDPEFTRQYYFGCEAISEWTVGRTHARVSPALRTADGHPGWNVTVDPTSP